MGVTHLRARQEKKHLFLQKNLFFRLALASAPARSISTLFRTRYFFIIGLRPVYTDPHQSPIGIKANFML
jgi:hypothetical protein